MIKILFYLTFLYTLSLFSYNNQTELEKASEFISQRKYTEAISILNKLIELNDPTAMNMLGLMYVEGMGVEKDGLKAFNLFKRSVEKDFIKAYYNLGKCYEYGIGTEIDIEKAIELYKKGYDKGDSKCAYALGKIYIKGCKIENKDTEIGVKYLKFSCNKKISQACYELAGFYEKDKKEIKKAIKYYIKSGDYNYFQAYTRVGDIYFYGKDIIERDLKKAKRYYEMACSGNEAVGCYRLGFIYFSGLKPVEKDEIKAFEFLNRALNMGYKPAYGILGVIYATSDKIGIDKKKAEEYLNIGVSVNDPYSVIMKKKLCEEMNIINCNNQ